MTGAERKAQAVAEFRTKMSGGASSHATGATSVPTTDATKTFTNAADAIAHKKAQGLVVEATGERHSHPDQASDATTEDLRRGRGQEAQRRSTSTEFVPARRPAGAPAPATHRVVVTGMSSSVSSDRLWEHVAEEIGATYSMHVVGARIKRNNEAVVELNDGEAADHLSRVLRRISSLKGRVPHPLVEPGRDIKVRLPLAHSSHVVCASLLWLHGAVGTCSPVGLQSTVKRVNKADGGADAASVHGKGSNGAKEEMRRKEGQPNVLAVGLGSRQFTVETLDKVCITCLCVHACVMTFGHPCPDSDVHQQGPSETRQVGGRGNGAPSPRPRRSRGARRCVESGARTRSWWAVCSLSCCCAGLMNPQAQEAPGPGAARAGAGAGAGARAATTKA